MDRGTCSSCQAAILWVETERGNVMPLDAEPCPDGNIVVEGAIARVLTGNLFEPKAEGPRYKSHFSSCPNAGQHRKRR